MHPARTAPPERFPASEPLDGWATSIRLRTVRTPTEMQGCEPQRVPGRLGWRDVSQRTRWLLRPVCQRRPGTPSSGSNTLRCGRRPRDLLVGVLLRHGRGADWLLSQEARRLLVHESRGVHLRRVRSTGKLRGPARVWRVRASGFASPRDPFSEAATVPCVAPDPDTPTCSRVRVSQ